MNQEIKWLDPEKKNLDLIHKRVTQLIEKYGLVEVFCPICDKKDYISLGYREGLQIVVCNNCDHVYVNPRLSVESVKDLYSMNYWSEITVNHGNPSLKERAHFDYENAYYKLQRDVLDQKKNGRLLDIGCSNGALIRRAIENGFHAIGIEPSPDVAQFAKETFGVDVVVGTIESSDLPNDHFDILLAHDVIEHVFDVNDFINGCFQKLRQGGMLVIETPTTDSVNFSYEGLNWMYCIPIEHINLFNQRNLIAKLEQVGFKILDVICPYEENMVIRVIK